MQQESTPSWTAEPKEKVKLTSLCHKEPQVFGTLVPIFEKHHLLLVSVTVVLLRVHVFLCCSLESYAFDFLNYRPRNVLHSTFIVQKIHGRHENLFGRDIVSRTTLRCLSLGSLRQKACLCVTCCFKRLQTFCLEYYYVGSLKSLKIKKF